MKTNQTISLFGITIPKGMDVISTDSCAVLVPYDESKGCTFSKVSGKGYAKPKNGTLIAVRRDMAS